MENTFIDVFNIAVMFRDIVAHLGKELSFMQGYIRVYVVYEESTKTIR